MPIIEIAADDPEILAGRPFRGANQRPDLPGWRAAMLARYDATDYGNIHRCSTPHRVVSPEGVEHRSLAFFLDPNPDALVACLPTCGTPDRPARYAPILAADYLRDRLDATYAHRRQG